MAFDIKGFRENVKRREAEQAAAMAARDTSRQKPPPRDPPPPRPSWRDQTIMAQDLCDKTYPAVSYVVPGLFPEGVILLVSRPKLGKSWLLQQIGSSVALGNPVLASPVEPDKPAHGDVLYLNLEDGEKRAQRRMTKHFGMRRESWPQRMRIARAWRRLDLAAIMQRFDSYAAHASAHA